MQQRAGHHVGDRRLEAIKYGLEMVAQVAVRDDDRPAAPLSSGARPQQPKPLELISINRFGHAGGRARTRGIAVAGVHDFPHMHESLAPSLPPG